MRIGRFHLASLPAATLLLAAALASLSGAAQAGGAGREEERAPRPAEGSAAPTVRAVVSPGQVQEGRLFTVQIWARNLRGTGAAAFHLVYDPELVEPVPSGFTEGTALRHGGVATSFMAAPASTGDRIMVGLARLGRKRAGASSITAGAAGNRGRITARTARRGRPAATREGGLLCTLTFRALKTGPATFVFDRARLTTGDAVPLQATFHPGRGEILPARPARRGQR